METLLHNVRLSYTNVWEPAPDMQGNLKYSVSILMPDTNKILKATCIKDIKQVLAKAVKNSKLNSKQQTVAYAELDGKLKQGQINPVALPLRNGSMEYESGTKDLNYKGFHFFNAKSTTKPSLVDENVDPVTDPNYFYSGCWANVAVTFYFTNAGGTMRVAVALNHLQFVKNDDRMDGRTNVLDVFKPLAEAEVEEEVPFD